MKGKRNYWVLLVLILAGLVIGGFIGTCLPWEWLNYGNTYGLTQPLLLNLGIISITFGLTINITISGIIGVVLAVIIFKFI
ncbi:MAG TPA: DUF4321 domain-containing protein [Lachnospiraceae bacterium]|nr:DUF4321 domain-containing protein [Lachnospiraceae bacterium]